jgi:hypothetical protein
LKRFVVDARRIGIGHRRPVPDEFTGRAVKRVDHEDAVEVGTRWRDRRSIDSDGPHEIGGLIWRKQPISMFFETTRHRARRSLARRSMRPPIHPAVHD